MARAKKKKFEWASVPLINYINLMDDDGREDLLKCLKEHEMVLLEEGSVEFHKEWLGRQKLCYQGGGPRFWVWEGDDWRVFASNTYGTSVEVRAGLSVDAAWETLKTYLAAVGMT